MTALWSPFCAVGLIPIITWAAIKEGYKPALSPQNLLVTPLLAFSILLYLTQGAGQVPFQFFWEIPYLTFSVYVLACTAEFLIILGILYRFEPKKRSLIVVLGAFLSLLCLFKGGEHNDLLMRGSMPSICMIAILVANSLMKSLKNREWHRELLVVYLIIGAFPITVAFVNGLLMERVNKGITFEKLTSLYTYEEKPYMTFYYLVKTENATKIFGSPFLRNLPKGKEGGM